MGTQDNGLPNPTVATGVIIVHGIGDPTPGETLQEFASAFRTYSNMTVVDEQLPCPVRLPERNSAEAVNSNDDSVDQVATRGLLHKIVRSLKSCVRKLQVITPVEPELDRFFTSWMWQAKIMPESNGHRHVVHGSQRYVFAEAFWGTASRLPDNWPGVLFGFLKLFVGTNAYIRAARPPAPDENPCVRDNYLWWRRFNKMAEVVWFMLASVMFAFNLLMLFIYGTVRLHIGLNQFYIENVPNSWTGGDRVLLKWFIEHITLEQFSIGFSTVLIGWLAWFLRKRDFLKPGLRMTVALATIGFLVVLADTILPIQGRVPPICGEMSTGHMTCLGAILMFFHGIAFAGLEIMLAVLIVWGAVYYVVKHSRFGVEHRETSMLERSARVSLQVVILQYTLWVSVIPPLWMRMTDELILMNYFPVSFAYVQTSRTVYFFEAIFAVSLFLGAIAIAYLRWNFDSHREQCKLDTVCRIEHSENEDIKSGRRFIVSPLITVAQILAMILGLSYAMPNNMHIPASIINCNEHFASSTVPLKHQPLIHCLVTTSTRFRNFSEMGLLGDKNGSLMKYISSGNEAIARVVELVLFRKQYNDAEFYRTMVEEIEDAKESFGNPPQSCDNATAGERCQFEKSWITTVTERNSASIDGSESKSFVQRFSDGAILLVLPLILILLVRVLDLANDVITYLNYNSNVADSESPRAEQNLIVRLGKYFFSPDPERSEIDRIDDHVHSVARYLRSQYDIKRFIVLSHSQGTVLAIQQLRREENNPFDGCDVDLVTMASPYEHLYQYYFPFRFPERQLKNLRYWLNLYRTDDFVGRQFEQVVGKNRKYLKQFSVGSGHHLHYFGDKRVIKKIREYLFESDYEKRWPSLSESVQTGQDAPGREVDTAQSA